MNEELIKARLRHVAHVLEDMLPEGYGFTLLTYQFGENPDNRLNYVSNSNREDVVKAMKEWIEKTENTYGQDVENN